MTPVALTFQHTVDLDHMWIVSNYGGGASLPATHHVRSPLMTRDSIESYLLPHFSFGSSSANAVKTPFFVNRSI